MELVAWRAQVELGDGVEPQFGISPDGCGGGVPDGGVPDGGGPDGGGPHGGPPWPPLGGPCGLPVPEKIEHY